MACSLAYCQYDWVDGETYTTDTIELPTVSTATTATAVTPTTTLTTTTDSSVAGSCIEFDYSFTHHIDHMTHAMIAKVGTPLRVTLHVSPAIREPTAAITSDNTAVRAKFESLMMLSNTPITSPMASSRSLSRSSNHTIIDSIDTTTRTGSVRSSIMNGGMQRSPTSRQSTDVIAATNLRTSVAQQASDLRLSSAAGVADNITTVAAATDSNSIQCSECGMRCTQCAAELQQLRQDNAELKQILQLVAATDMTASNNETSIVRARLAAAIALDHQSNTATAAPS
jgi:hypothetical protein